MFVFSVLVAKTLFGQNWSKNKSCLFKWRFGTKTNLNMQNSIVHFFCFQPKTPFLGKFGPNNQSCQFRLKCGTRINSNMQNSMVMFSFFFFWLNRTNSIVIFGQHVESNHSFSYDKYPATGYFVKSFLSGVT